MAGRPTPTSEAAAARPAPAGPGQRRRGPRRPRRRGRSFLLTFIAVVALAAFLSPLAPLGALTSLKTPDQITQAGSPLLPGRPGHVRVPGRGRYDVYLGPDRRRRPRSSPCSNPAASRATFIDPANPDAGADHLGSARGGRSTTPWQFAPHFENFADGLEPHRLPAAAVQHGRCIAVIGMIGTRRSRARWSPTGSRGSGSPAGTLLFTLLIATIFLPAAVTIIPTYTIFVEARLGRDVAAAAGADVLRQRLRRLPDAPVLHDDPDRDGRGGGHRRGRPVPDADGR